MKIQCISFLIIAGTCFLMGAQVVFCGTPPAKKLWAGKSSDLSVSWTTVGVKVVDIKSQRMYLNVNSQVINKEGAEGIRYQVETTWHLLSCVGPFISFCSISRKIQNWQTIQYIPNNSKPVLLSDLFPKIDIFNELMKDSYIQKALIKRENPIPPKDLDDLIAILSGDELGHRFGFGADMLSGFAFHHMESDKIVVRINSRNRSIVFQTDLLLSIPLGLKAALLKVSSGKEGIFMSQTEKLQNITIMK